MVIFLAGGRGFTRREGLRRLKERIEKVPGCTDVRYEPSRLRPRTVVADVNVEMFLGISFPRTAVTLEIEEYEDTDGAPMPATVDAAAAAETSDNRAIDDIYGDLGDWATALEERRHSECPPVIHRWQARTIALVKGRRPDAHRVFIVTSRLS